MHRIASLLTLAAALALAGCVPERVVWSPDGTQAAVLADDGLRLCALDGTLGPVLAPQNHPLQAKAAAWLPDGHHLVITHDDQLATWKEIAAAFPRESQALVTNTEELTKVRTALVNAAPNSPDDFAKAIPQGNDDDKRAVLYLRDNEADTLRPKLGDHWNALAALTAPEEVAQLLTLHGNTADVSAPLLHGRVDLVYTLRVCPTGTVIAIAASEGDGGYRSDITLVSTDGSATRDLGEGALYPDWSPDGKYLFYIAPATPPQSSDRGRIGMLLRVQALNDAGHLIGISGGMPAGDALAGLLFDDGLRIRVAKDGRIFFIAAEIHLPTTPTDINPNPVLFSIDPAKQATVSRVVPRASEPDLGDALALFELSPDNTHLSVPFKDGRVSVLDLATGKVDLVQPLTIGKDGQSGDALTSVPTWRPTAPGGELTFVQPTENHGPPAEVVRYSLPDGKRIPLSTTWPDEAKGHWLNRSPTTAPATQP